MPRLPAIHDPNLRSLAEELRFAPRHALLKHIAHAETLAGVIEAEQTYPPAWVVYRVTGFRPEHVEGPESTGEALLESLSAFAEHLCEAASIDADEIPPGAVTPEELCGRWGISRKSLDRARRQGLVGRRIRSQGPTRRLVFMPDAVAAYENRARPAASPAGRRMSPEVRLRIIRRARRYHDRLGLTINQAAQRLGPRFGYSPEAVRSALKRAEAHAGGEAVFGEQGPPTPREQELAFRAARRGLKPEAVARRLGRPRASVWRAANAHRATLLSRLDLSGPVAPPFALPDAAEVILARPPVLEGTPRRLRTDLLGLLAQARAAPKPDAAIERDLALALHFLRWSARRAIAELPSSAPEARAIDRIETNLRSASRLKERLVVDSLGLLVATMERRLGHEAERIPPRALADLTRAMLAALSQAADRYDPARGGRLAAPASLALDKAAATWISNRARDTQVAGRARRALTAADPGGRVVQALDPWQHWLEPDARIPAVLGRLTPPDAELLARRFGLGPHRPHTLDELAAWLELPHMHAARRERAALRAALAAARGTMTT